MAEDKEQFFKAWHESNLENMRMQEEVFYNLREMIRCNAEAIHLLNQQVDYLGRYIKMWIALHSELWPKKEAKGKGVTIESSQD